jgi:hypothetical protein
MRPNGASSSIGDDLAFAHVPWQRASANPRPWIFNSSMH